MTTPAKAGTKPSQPKPSQHRAEKDRVVIFDTTLRDGEQCPGATMTHEEKLEVAELLDDMGVDIIEAGFPVASEGDFAAVNEIAKRAKRAVVCGLARASFKDIDRAGEAIKPARQESERPFARLGNDTRDPGFLGEDLEWQENLEVHFAFSFTSSIVPIM